MAPQHLRAPLHVAQIVAFATLVRSVAFDRWITVLVSALLLGGVWAASRGRTWGVGLMLAMASAFPVMFFLGMAPAWFVFVGLAGAMPFLSSLPAFLRFDRQATAIFATVAASIGTAIAYGYHAWAPWLLTNLPVPRPTFLPHHPLLIAVVFLVGFFFSRRREQIESGGVRVATAGASDDRVRVSLDDVLEENEDRETPPARRQARL